MRPIEIFPFQRDGAYFETESQVDRQWDFLVEQAGDKINQAIDSHQLHLESRTSTREMQSWARPPRTKTTEVKRISRVASYYGYTHSDISSLEINERTVLVINKAKEGDTAELANLFEDKIRKPFEVFLRTKGGIYNGQDREDFVQEIFTKTLASIEKYKIEDREAAHTRFVGWMRRIALNYRTDLLRKSSRLEFSPLESEEITDLHANVDEIEALHNRWSMHEIRKAVVNLSLKQSELVILRYVFELTPNEIAEIYGIKAVDVRQRLRRINQRLKKIVEPTPVNRT